MSGGNGKSTFNVNIFKCKTGWPNEYVKNRPKYVARFNFCQNVHITEEKSIQKIGLPTSVIFK
jgi:hypothetical protein